MEHRKLSCSEIQEYIDGLSQRQLQAKIENSPECEHIQQCVTCREYYDRAKGLSEKLDQWSVPNLKRNITAGVMAQIAQLERDRKIDHFNLWSRFPALFARRLKVPAGVAAAVFVMLTASLIFNITSISKYHNPNGNIQQFYPVAIQPKVIQMQSVSKEEMCFFGMTPEGAATPIVIILGVPGVVPIETTYQPVTANLTNQRL